MKKQILTILAVAFCYMAQAQTVATLPANTVPYGTQVNLQKTTGNVYVGNAAYQFRALALKSYTDSLLALKYNATNPAGYITSSSLNGYVPTTRTLTINGTTLDLSANRSWTIAPDITPLQVNTTNRTVWNTGKSSVATNTSFGEAALSNNTTGGENVAIGNGASQLNQTGSQNTSVGRNSLFSNRSEQANTAIGFEALRDNITSNNTAVGHKALVSNTTGNFNTGIGQQALLQNLGGSNNTAIGFAAGSQQSGGANTVSNNSVYVGVQTRALSNNQTNQIVIGYNAIGAGSNTATLGNTNITLTRLRGQVNMESIKLDAMNTAPASATATGTVGEIRVTDTHIYVCIATNTWVRTALTTW